MTESWNDMIARHEAERKESHARRERAERTDAIVLCVMLYLFGGVVVLALMGVSGALDHDSLAESVAVLVFWPLFVVKYAALGGWEVLVALWDLLLAK